MLGARADFGNTASHKTPNNRGFMKRAVHEHQNFLRRPVERLPLKTCFMGALRESVHVKV